jgi:hypothetical protein
MVAGAESNTPAFSRSAVNSGPQADIFAWLRLPPITSVLNRARAFYFLQAQSLK